MLGAVRVAADLPCIHVDAVGQRKPLLSAGADAARLAQPCSYPKGWATSDSASRQHGNTRTDAVLLNPFCPFTTAKVLALKATVLLLFTLLIKARVQIAAFSALGVLLLLLQTLVFLAISGGLVVAAGGAALVARQQRRPAAA